MSGSGTEARGAHAGLADAAMANIAGQRDAQALLHTLRGGCAPANLLLEAHDQVAASGNGERRRAFMRTLQKLLERCL